MPKTITKPKDEIKSVSDDFGNLLVCKDNGTRIILSLKLVAEKKYRRIGVINRKQKTISIRRNREKHLFRKNSSYGFNHKLLNDSQLFDKIRLTDDFSEYVIPKAFILENGSYLNFLNKGFELQIFITLDQISQYKREPKI